jgi:hypothetical protein
LPIVPKKDWYDKLNDALCAYITVFKNHMGMYPYKIVYGSACNLPLDLEKKAYRGFKELKLFHKNCSEKNLNINLLAQWRIVKMPNSVNKMLKCGIIKEFRTRRGLALENKCYQLALNFCSKLFQNVYDLW